MGELNPRNTEGGQEAQEQAGQLTPVHGDLSFAELVGKELERIPPTGQYPGYSAVWSGVVAFEAEQLAARIRARTHSALIGGQAIALEQSRRAEGHEG